MTLALEGRHATSKGNGQPPFALLQCLHVDRTVYVTFGMLGQHLISLCQRDSPGCIIGERCAEDGLEALTLVVELAYAEQPDFMILDQP